MIICIHFPSLGFFMIFDFCTVSERSDAYMFIVCVQLSGLTVSSAFSKRIGYAAFLKEFSDCASSVYPCMPWSCNKIAFSSCSFCSRKAFKCWKEVWLLLDKIPFDSNGYADIVRAVLSSSHLISSDPEKQSR